MSVDSEDNLDQTAAPLIDHLIELRQRLIWCVAYIIITFGICYFFVEEIYAFLAQPFVDVSLKYGQNPKMIYTGLHEAFFVYIKVAFFAAICVSFPLISMQIWKFVAPGLYKNEKRAFLPFLIGTPILFTLGAALAYYIIIPLAWDFFISFQVSTNSAAEAGTGLNKEHVASLLSIEVLPTVKEYWSLVMMLILAFGLSFELPILLLLLARVGLVTADGLASKRKYMVVGAFLFAAVMTPPDIVSQIGLGIPILLLYELSIIAIRLTIKEKADV
ncbi:twin-arginine translocase subunit TatC [Luteithermobacter gelatinilyticus]|uniref:twin-arginine translocase subunit TatC n=1 Tax=Luteithermobacter gelatinilyticus TaxID=2582913 RepID=UPI0011058364|nr:twin-arginine translocase subunit TatC [Luteithermobacter gelatinilyticus]